MRHHRMKSLYVMVILSCFLSISHALTVRELMLLVEKFHQDCKSDSSKQKPDINSKEKCSIKATLYFDCIPEQKRNTTTWVRCSDRYFYSSDLMPVTCQANGKFKTNEKAYCRLLPLVIQNEKRESLIIKYNVTTERAVERERSLRHHSKQIQNLRQKLLYLDFITCFFGLVILFIFVPIKHERIFLHRHLILSFMLRDLLSIVLESMHLDEKMCSMLFVFTQFLLLAQICWMFNEGFYQFKHCFFVFAHQSKNNMWLYFFFGWGFPSLVTFAIYLPCMWLNSPTRDFKICWASYRFDSINYIIYAPVFFLLFLNMIIVIYLMLLIWKKLQKSSNSQLYKAGKATRSFSILIFLLGGGYMFTLYGPRDCLPFRYGQAVVRTTQGFCVCVAHVLCSRKVWEEILTRCRDFVHYVNQTGVLGDSTTTRVIEGSSHNERGSRSIPGGNDITADAVCRPKSQQNFKETQNSSSMYSKNTSTAVSLVDVSKLEQSRHTNDAFLSAVNQAFENLTQRSMRGVFSSTNNSHENLIDIELGQTNHGNRSPTMINPTKEDTL